PTPQGGTSASGGSSSPPSGGTSSGGDISEDSRQGFNKLTNILSIASASLNGLIQTVDGSGSAFTNGISGILGSVTTLSSSFSVLEELTGQQINSVSDFLALNQTTGKSFAGIDEDGNKKEGGIADLIEKNLGSGFFGKLTTNLTVGVGNMIGAFSQGAAAFQLVSSTLLSFNTTQAQLDSAIKSGNVELAGSLAVQNDTIKDITSAGGYVAGGIAVVAQGLASLATIFPALVPTFAAIAAPVAATIGPFIAIAAAIALATGAILALTGNFDIVTNSFIYLRDTIRDVASYLAGLIGIQVDTAEQANKKSKTKAELESSNARIQNLAQAQQREQNLSLDLFSKGKIDTKEAFKPFNDEAKAVLDNQKISRERMQVLQETNVNGKNDAEINALKNESRKTF
ncbi:hypothetical protein EBQ93_01305, partial [bacterium]|nr:hypothetical protein [bacterium]